MLCWVLFFFLLLCNHQRKTVRQEKNTERAKCLNWEWKQGLCQKKPQPNHRAVHRADKSQRPLMGFNTARKSLKKLLWIFVESICWRLINFYICLINFHNVLNFCVMIKKLKLYELGQNRVQCSMEQIFPETVLVWYFSL